MQTTEQKLQQQKDDAERDRKAVVAATTTAPATINAGLDYLAKHTSSGTVMRWSKEGMFVLPTQGDLELPEGTELVCHWYAARAGR